MPDFVLFVDEHLLAVNKPAGLLSLPHGYEPNQPHLRSLLEPKYGPLWIVHRLDKDTSGLILLARSAAAHRHLNRLFELRQVHKTYHALVCGNPDWKTRTVHLRLRTNGDHRHRTVVDARRGRLAETDLQVLERFNGHYALLEAKPRTGRTHQIRVHLTAAGQPLVGDALYGGPAQLLLSELFPGRVKRERRSRWGEWMEASDAQPPAERPLIERPALHAHSLSLVHPCSGAPLALEAPYSDDFARALRHLRRFAPPKAVI